MRFIVGFTTFQGPEMRKSFPLQVQGRPEAEAAYLEKSESWDGDGPPKQREKTTPENIENGNVGNDEP
jgi:hypothetical protein